MNKYIMALRPVIDLHGKFLLLFNPKVAMQSITHVMLNRLIFTHRGYRNWQTVWYEMFHNRLEDVFMFTFVRNPWDRVLSAFLFLKNQGKIGAMWRFKDYVTEVLDKQGPKVNAHFKPQVSILLYRGEKLPVTIGRFETLSEDWKKIAKKLKLPERLPQINKTEHTHYINYYDYHTMKIVENIYQEDIELLGYKYGD